jgi:hypothetical protein
MAVRIQDFDIWQPGYGGALVSVLQANTSSLAQIYRDEACTVAASNPVTLDRRDVDGISYGKWPWDGGLYATGPVELSIDSADRTGIIRPPLTSLSGVDASGALVTATGGSVAHSLAGIVARVFYATNYGALAAGDAAAASNNATLIAALGAAAGAGGGIVLVPAGTYKFTALQIAGGVILQGQGRGVTILQSQTADRCVTLAGDRAGLREITIDGVNNTVGSTGVYGLASRETILHDVDIKRFQTGVHFKGCRRLSARDFYLTNNVNGGKFHGDSDAGDGGDGDGFLYNEWQGGAVTLHSGVGLDFSYEDMECWHNVLRDIGFEDNTGTAIRINGARWLRAEGCWFTGNTVNLDILDDTDASTAARQKNTVEGIQFVAGEMDSGEVNLRDTLLDVSLVSMRFSEVDFSLTSPKNGVLLRDCSEIDVTVSGTASYLRRWYKNDHGATTGITTDATVTKAWARTLEPGEVVYLVARVIGNQRNGTGVGAYLVAVTAKRAGSTLAYDAQTANFTVGDVLTGQTSGATARIIGDSDGGTTGTLTLRDIQGEFQDNEIITGAAGGSANANGALVAGSVSLLGSNTDLRAVYEDDAAWAAAFAANGPEVELRVTGAASKTIEWVCDVDCSSTL